MTDNKLLLAISEMLDKKLDSELTPIKNDIRSMQDDIHSIKMFQENIILPRLNTIESCYTDTYDRYKNHSDKMEEVFSDVDLLKKVVSEHSEKLQKIG